MSKEEEIRSLLSQMQFFSECRYCMANHKIKEQIIALLPDAGEFMAELTKHLLSEKARIKQCIKRDEKKHEDFQKQLGKEYSGHVQSSIEWFKEDLAWVNKYLKTVAHIESLAKTIDSLVNEKFTLYGNDYGFLATDNSGQQVWVNSVCTNLRIKDEEIEQQAKQIAELQKQLKEKGEMRNGS